MPADQPKESDSIQEMEALRDQHPMSLSGEFVVFLRENKKWWMVPILLVFAAAAIIIKLSASGAAPLIYSFF